MTDAKAQLSGYTIVMAGSPDGRRPTIAKGSPVLHGGASIKIYETFEVM